jgi:hypothetical protein
MQLNRVCWHDVAALSRQHYRTVPRLELGFLGTNSANRTTRYVTRAGCDFSSFSLPPKTFIFEPPTPTSVPNQSQCCSPFRMPVLAPPSNSKLQVPHKTKLQTTTSRVRHHWLLSRMQSNGHERAITSLMPTSQEVDYEPVIQNVSILRSKIFGQVSRFFFFLLLFFRSLPAVIEASTKATTSKSTQFT